MASDIEARHLQCSRSVLNVKAGDVPDGGGKDRRYRAAVVAHEVDTLSD